MKRIFTILSLGLALTAVSCNTNEEETEVPITADFVWDASDVLVGDQVTFTEQCDGKPTRWDWTFEGGTPATSNLSCPVVTWAEAGTYSVTMSVTKDGKTETVTKQNIINVDYYKTVTADLSFDKTMLFTNEEITFTNLSKGFPNTVKWTFTSDTGEKVVSDEYNPVLKFEPGVYTISLVVSSPVSTNEKVVAGAFTVLDPYAVIAGIGASNRTTYAGGTVSFKDASQGNVKGWEWTFEGGTPATSGEQNPVVVYQTPGTYKVSLKAFNERYNDSASLDGYVRVLPSKDLVFLLPFDGDSKDYGPNRIDPQDYSMGGYVKSYVEGFGGIGQAMKFPGGTKGKNYSVLMMPDDRISDLLPNGTPLTLSVRYKTGPVAANEALYAIGHCPGFETSNQLWGRFQTGNVFRTTAETTGMTSNTAQPSSPLFQDGEWHTLTVVYTRDEGAGGVNTRDLIVYLDGTKMGSNDKKADKETDMAPFCIGANLRWTNNAPAPENMFSGPMDDFVVYKRALTAAEVAEISK